MRLWIIGNGFDLYHGLKTSYLDYKAYVCQHRTCKSKNREIPPKFLPREVCRNCCTDQFKKRDCPVQKFNTLPRTELKENLWRDLEEACSVDLDALLDHLDGLDRNADIMLLHRDLDFAEVFTGDDFRDWLRDVERSLGGPENRKLEGLGPHDLFLTFNYTTTLQKVYGILDERIKYVHGSVEDAAQIIEEAKRKEKERIGVDAIIKVGRLIHSCLAFGSPDLSDEAIRSTVDRCAKSKHLSAEYAEEICHNLTRQVELLKKDVQSRVKPIKDFVEKKCDPSALDEIVVAGHSLGRIDRPYFDYLTDYFRCVKWRFLFHTKEDIVKAFEFCERYGLDGYCVPWDSLKKSIHGGVPCPDRGGVECPGFSICWPSKHDD